MPSDTIPPSQQIPNPAQGALAQQTPNPAQAARGPTASGILSALKDADSPLAFIQANIRPKDIPQQAAEEITAKRHMEEAARSQAPVPEAPKKVEPEYDLNPKPKVEEAKKDAAQPTVPVPPVPAPETGDDREENFKKLRTKLGETTSALKEKDKEIESLQSKVKRYENGEEFPDVIKKLQDENSKLSRYEKIVALKTSPEYEDKFIKPIGEIKTRLSTIAKDYGIPETAIERAINITNKRELNTFLSEHFDDVGALEVKQLISNVQDIQTQAKAAEAEPSKVLEDLRIEHEGLKKQEQEKNINSIVTSSKDAWIDSLLRIRTEGKVRELIPKEGDEEYNKTYVEPILRTAGTEYGKLVRLLAENGLRSLPKDLGHAIARMVHLAFASSMSIEARERAEAEAEDLRKNSERTTRYGRPLGAVVQGGTGEAPPAPKAKNPEDAAQQILNQVMTRR